MCGLSNFFRWRDSGAGSASGTTPIVVRPVKQDEVDDALRLLLGSNGYRADEQSAREFVRFALLRGLDLGTMRVAISENKLISSAIPILSPGKTALLMTSTAGASIGDFNLLAEGIGGCVRAICDTLDAGQTQIAQLLVEPSELAVADAVRRVGFNDLATLIYLQRAIIRPFPLPVLPGGYELIHYSNGTHELFAQGILASYEHSLDCPQLHGKRNILDIIAGHQSAGEFQPDLWFCLVRDGIPMGVLLLAPATSHGTMELVYIGLSLAARGQHLGDYFVSLALHQTHARRMGHLTLAVDASNTPALHLYHRHGLAEVHRRNAMLLEIR